MMKHDLKVMLVDDNEDFLEVLSMDVEDLGFVSITARGVDEAFEKMETAAVDVIVSDLHMEGKSGMDFIFELREKQKLIPFIFLTGGATKSVALEALRNGAFDLLEKPIEPAELARVLLSAGKLVKRLQGAASVPGQSAVSQNSLRHLSSSSAAFDDLVEDSGITVPMQQNPASPVSFIVDDPGRDDSGAELPASYIQEVKRQIDGVLKRNETALGQLENGQFAKTALSFLCRSYNLVRESATLIKEDELAKLFNLASNCFSHYRLGLPQT